MKLLLVTVVTCLALQSTCSQAGPVSQASLVSNAGAIDGDLSCTSTLSTLSSNGFKYNKTELKNDITKMEVVQKISASPCIQGFSFGFKGPEAWVDKGCRAKFRFSFCHSAIGSLCPKGFEAITQNLDGAGKIWSQPHPLATRTKDECAAICLARSGCTSFEFAEGESYHGACGTYTGGDANVQGDENRLSANSNWRSCQLKPRCHAGEMYDGNCYLLVSTPETWPDAQLGCSSRNASLASIHNAATNDFIANLAGGGGSRTWIGASDSKTEGEWRWTDGNIVTFSDWDRGQPDNNKVNWGGDQDCLVINFLETRKWDDDGCWRKHPYVCQGQKLRCESGWKQHGDRCYKVFLELLTTYTDASEKCISVQADVAALETHDENAFIKELLEQEQIPLGIDLWLSGRRQSEDSPYVWVTGEEMAYNDWSGGQPQQRSELCMQIYKNNNPTWQWYTEACNVSQNDNGVLCEKTAN